MRIKEERRTEKEWKRQEELERRRENVLLVEGSGIWPIVVEM